MNLCCIVCDRPLPAFPYPYGLCEWCIQANVREAAAFRKGYARGLRIATERVAGIDRYADLRGLCEPD